MSIHIVFSPAPCPKLHSGISQQQVWTGQESSLQLLILPASTSDPLPTYKPTPEYLDPQHCRLCLESLSHTTLETHLAEKHPQHTVATYRRQVLQKTVAEWPQAISPQVLRSRLAAFKKELCDDNYAVLPCAVCARMKRQCKLHKVVFPPRGSDIVPTWLSDIVPASQWSEFSVQWYSQLDDIFDIENYLEHFFEAGSRLSDAQSEVLAFSSEDEMYTSFKTVEAAQSWERRVKQWIQNLRGDLVQDSVPAPGREGMRWMLFQSSNLQVDAETGAISCSLCKHCKESLRHLDKKKAAARMPQHARANGLWHGPDPAVLSDLSYAECKVINLARIYVSVKRVFLDCSSYARTSKSEAPLYHQRNVVAYPQNPDAALTAVGMTPKNLARMLTVQFVGSDREALNHEPDLCVSVPKLRKAFHWLSLNSWPFMEATKQHALWENPDVLDDGLESLLRKYELSIGKVTGVPSELIQGASRIAAEHAKVCAAGPADCTPSSEDLQQETGNTADGGEDCAKQCAAVLDGGVDDITPVQIWNAVMKKYKVAQQCDDQLRRPELQGDASERHKLLRDKALAIAEAVDALAKLHHKETIAKLKDLLYADQGQNASLKVTFSDTFLNNSDPLYWCKCFMRLFPRGDCQERCLNSEGTQKRRTPLPSWRWAKCLLTRADFALWRLDVEFVASLYNVFLRRDQIWAVEASMKGTLSHANVAEIQKVTASGLVAHALSSGDVNSVRSLLKQKNLHGPLKQTFQRMQIIQRSVRGSEAEKDSIMPKFFGLRLWSGCSSLFFTLNPHDIRSPLTLLLVRTWAREENLKSFFLGRRCWNHGGRRGGGGRAGGGRDSHVFFFS